jgi:protein tyrosine phosphatase (PTP) superfamily phosphohydrolase (DUF442 family)
LPISRFKARVAAKVQSAERALRTGWGGDLSTPAGRRAAHLHLHLADHQFLRTWWTNLHEFAPGAWRANQPSPAQLARYKARGVRTILNLRGATKASFFLLEEEACTRLDMTLATCAMSARSLVSRTRMLELLSLFETIEKPFLMHCKSGADRTGLAAALYLLHIERAPVEVAARQLHWRFVHFRKGATGVLDHMLDAYARDHRASGISIRDWIETVYDPHRLMAEWDRAQGITTPRRKKK